MKAILLAMTGMDAATWKARITALEPERDVRIWPEVADAADIAYVCAWKPPAGAIAALPKLEAIFSLGAGVDALLADPELPDAPLVRIVDADLTARMSEYVVLNALLHHRRMLRAFDDQKAHRWTQYEQPAASAVRVGVMGLGELGQDAAAKLRVMGFRVAGWSRSPRTVDGIETFAGAEQLPAFLARTDILVVLLPLTPSTRGIIDHALLAGLARDGALGGPVLINAGRGGLQNEPELLAALDDGTLAAASLDVFETEPLPADSPFWDRANVILTPHAAADSDPDALTRYILGQIRRFEAGESLSNVVDRATGY